MANTYSITAPITYQQDVYASQISTLAFDPVSDVLWAGNGLGQVAAFYRNRMRGVAFPVGKNYVSSLYARENQVYAMTMEGQGLGAWTKGGVNIWQYRAPPNTTLSTFAQGGYTLVAVSNKAEFLVLNTKTGTIGRKMPCPPQVVNLHVSHSLVFSGSSDGLLRTHDLRATTKKSAGTELSVRAHQGSIQAIESSGNWVYTIGWTIRNGRPTPDSQVKIFDARNLKTMSSFNFANGPSLLNVHPLKSTTLVLTANTGVVNVVDILKPDMSELYQLETHAFIVSSAVSPTGAYIAFGDTEGTVHLLSSVENDDLPFNGFDGQPAEWADPPPPLPEIEWDDNTPLNLIGMPYYSDYLLSAYDKDFQTVPEYYPPPMKIPSQILSSLRQVDGLAFAQMPRELQGKRNVIPTTSTKRQGRFRSEKSRQNGGSPPPESPVDTQQGDRVPRHYQKVEIEYSKFGVEDFDFAFYNKTPFSGLETHILNSYTNSLIQAMHYVLPLRRIAKSHITTPCAREYCLLCELGFVMRMLEDAKGINCQATNFCKTIPNLQSATTYGVVDYVQDGQETNYGAKIQLFNRFLVETIKSEGNAAPDNPVINPTMATIPPNSMPPPVTQLLGINSKSVMVCSNCKRSKERPDTAHIVDMVYPRRLASNETLPPSDFASVLRNSLLRDYIHKATCQFCKQQTIQQIRRPVAAHELPPLMLINASIHNDDALKFWRDARTTRFLKPFIGIDVNTEPSQVGGTVADSIDTTSKLVWYELRSMVIDVKKDDKQSHLVSIVKVPHEELSRNKPSPWFVFNDFSVRNISEDEALSFPGDWKVPAVIYLERSDIREVLDFSGLPMQVDPYILSQDISLSIVRDNTRKAHEPLESDEFPKPGTVVAVDAEFVQMQQEETELFTDGSRRVIRPARLGLARVSVIRGSGDKESVPFIDDYIHTSEEIVDYLTEFSGIQPGDLNPHMSSHTLVPLKVAYKKLRLLIDLGCIFVGHGLSKDFRIINIFVPPDQVIDTVDLYFIKERQRRISLRFLAWYILKQDIQQETHDSIEDARSALSLYKAYQEMEEQGTFDAKLEELYRAGREHNWKPPSVTKASPPAPHASPSPGSTPSTFFPRANVSPSFAGLDALQNQFQAFTLNPQFRAPYLPLSPDMSLSRPYSPPRTPQQNQSHHRGKRGAGSGQQWVGR